ncbi:ABC transporter ATP-binding protein [Halobacillus salinarum]|uniref:ABC transporter ATP-binding protein n=1 Tax=Halobacillus salinarum TaxID=2932257 RepID=A0ABY4EGM2_9BACI|nr:ABC transporter ATP-binding protein [Halobacillus salinarum]UOQ42587.1 ABC transporter ATP-binding protein [Halobacillus salinarum]
MDILKAVDIETRYDNHSVFTQLNLRIPEGKVTTLIGPNGCGKSTLLKTMGRILKHTYGQVYLQSKELHTLPTKQVAQMLSLLPQQPEAPGELTVEELVSYGRYPHRKNMNKLTRKDKEVIEWAMNITRIHTFRNRKLATLSGGQGQKVWLAMALAQETKILLLDEPTTYLDMAHQLEVLEIIKHLNEAHHCTVVMVLHDINQAARFSHEIVAMKNGEIITTGTPKEIIHSEVLEKVFHIHARTMIDPYNGAPVCFGYESALQENTSETDIEKESIK